VNACSLDGAFVDSVIDNARLFSDLVVVSLGTRLHDGRPEDSLGEAGRLVKDHDQEAGLCPVTCAIYDVMLNNLADPIALHNLARRAGVSTANSALTPSTPYWALLLDGDEVPDGPAVGRWWRGDPGEHVRRNTHTAHKMANLWLFLHPRLASEETQDSAVLVHSDALAHDEALQHPRERDGILLWNLTSPLGMRNMRVEHSVMSLDGHPMIWHFSWVREGGRGALKAKCANWGHCGEREWATLIDEAFDAIEAGRWPTRDFVHNRHLRLLDPCLPDFLGNRLKELSASDAFLC
jgi:hypothetical protein